MMILSTQYDSKTITMTANIYIRHGSLTISILIHLVIVLCPKDVDPASSTEENEVIIPPRFRSEGLVILDLKRNDDSQQHEQHHLPFIEFVDSVKFQATVSIGHVSYEPNNYYKKLGSPMIEVLGDEFCSSLKNSTTPFVPEISWFADILLPVDRVAQLAATIKHNIGPTGLLLSLLSLQKSLGATTMEQYEAEHRYVKCHVSSRKFRLDSKGIDFHLEIYTPRGSEMIESNVEGRYFSIRVTASFEAKDNPYKLNSATITLDYVNFHQIDLDLNESMDRVFQLPLGRGCSKYLKHIKPNFDGLRSSFSLEYKQLTEPKSIKLSYDHSSALLQRETLGSDQVSIWDLNRSLLINIGYEREAMYMTSLRNVQPNWDLCAILNVEDKQLGSILRPNQDGALKLNFLGFVGATSVAYMGRGSVRDLPCLIYESIVPEAPAIFGLTESKPNQVRDYIVQFHLLKGSNDHETVSENYLSSVDFKPLRLTLIRRFKIVEKEDELVEELEVYDFSWSLNSRGGELFRVSECFGAHAVASEQVELNAALTFERVKDENSSIPAEDWFDQLWPLNKPKLELEMLNDLLRLLKTNRLYLVDYDLKPKGEHLDVSMNLADWAYQPRRVSLVAEGTLTSEFIEKSISHSDTIRYKPSSEHICLARASLIKSASLVIYCSENIIVDGGGGGTAEIPICITTGQELESRLLGGFQRSPEGNQIKSASVSHCRCYRFGKPEGTGRASKGLGGVKNVIENKDLLRDHSFRFLAKTPTEARESWLPKVHSFELKHDIRLETIDNYAFHKDWLKHGNDTFHTFDSMAYKNLEACTRMCDLDVGCRSYSFCLPSNPMHTSSNSNSCVISALDLRASKIREQLERKQANAENITTVTAHGIGMRYNLIGSSKCKIYERNYMDIFRETEEVIRLRGSNANEFPKTDTTFGCAKLSANSLQQVAMFAYCATSNLCILDENLFSNNDGNNSVSNSNLAGDAGEIACRVYRKKYQSFFRVSSHVIKQSSLDNDGQQIHLDQADSVEACARFCLDKSEGQCYSFDFCEPGVCLINQVGPSGPDQMELKTGCLHYGRDFSPQAMDNDNFVFEGQQLENSEDSGLMSGLLTCSIVMASILLGIRIGNRLHDSQSNNSIYSFIRNLMGYRISTFQTTSNNQPAVNLGGEQGNIAMRLFQLNE